MESYNALVICNHGPPPPPPPPTHTHTPGGTAGIAVEMRGASAKVLPWQCEENTWGLLFISKKGHEMK